MKFTGLEKNIFSKHSYTARYHYFPYIRQKIWLMARIVLDTFEHKGATQIGINFPYNFELKNYIKSLKGVTWSQSHKRFYIAFSAENKRLLYDHLRAKGHFVVVPKLKKPVVKTGKGKNETVNLTPENKKALHKYVSYLRGKRYSESTVRTYYSFVLKFMNFLKVEISNIEARNIEVFIEKVIAKQKYSISSHRQCISAIKHFIELFELEKIQVEQLKMPKKDQNLPNVLAKEEIIRILQATQNLKHRAILALIYSAGLRIGELLQLKLKDIDLERRQIHIIQSKGRKDRYALLAESFLPLLHNYINTYQPTEYFVEGANGGPYTAESVRAFLKRSCKRAGIKKKVSPHTLRHSFATHMMENGIGIRHIQELLGHSKPETTMVYTHIARKDLMQLQSPLDATVKEIMKDSKNNTNIGLSGKY